MLETSLPEERCNKRAFRPIRCRTPMMPQRRMINLALFLLFTSCADDGASDSPNGNPTTGSSDADTSSASGSADDGVDVGTTTTADDDGATTTSDSSGDSTTSRPSGCVVDDDCDGLQPFCDSSSGGCVDCSSAPEDACASLGMGTDACSDTGVCVECTRSNATACGSNTPICESATNACRECTEHSECPDSACKIRGSLANSGEGDWGSCFSPDSVRHIDGGGGRDFETLSAALAGIPVSGERVAILHETVLPYTEAITVDSGRAVAILAAEGEEPVWRSEMGPHLRVNAGSQVWLHRIAMGEGNTSAAAVEASGGEIHVQRAVIEGRIGGALTATSGARVHLENTIAQGGGSGTAAIEIEDADVLISYSTIAMWITSGESVVNCAPGGGLVVSDSIIANYAFEEVEEVTCDGADVTTSSLVTSFDAEEVWFVAPSSDYHLAPGHPFGDVAEWNFGDPLIDIDGDLRPSVDGSPDVAGADVP